MSNSQRQMKIMNPPKPEGYNQRVFYLNWQFNDTQLASLDRGLNRMDIGVTYVRRIRSDTYSVLIGLSELFIWKDQQYEIIREILRISEIDSEGEIMVTIIASDVFPSNSVVVFDEQKPELRLIDADS